MATLLVQPPDDYLLEELIWCLRCSRQMVPAPRVDGTRYYSCGLDCEQPDLPAIQVEQDLLLPALVRAYAVLYGVGRRVEARTSREPAAADEDEYEELTDALSFTGATPWRVQGELVVPDEERNAWLRCDPRNHRAVLLTAYVRVTVNAEGTVYPVWRHAERHVANEVAETTS